LEKTYVSCAIMGVKPVSHIEAGTQAECGRI